MFFPSDDQYEVLSDLPEDSVVFYCQLCRESGEGGGGGGGGVVGVRSGGEGVEVGEGKGGEILTWRKAVNDFMLQSFLKVL